MKVCDFGLSQLFEKGQKIMDEKRPKGTPLYMAPEVWLGKEFNEKADVYRCGPCSLGLRGAGILRQLALPLS